jgi:hypothetical protein
MSLFGSSGGGGMFPRASEADLAGNGTPNVGRPTPPGQHRAQAYAAKMPADEAQRLAAAVGAADRALEFGFRARGGQLPAEAAGPGAPRDGAGVR